MKEVEQMRALAYTAVDHIESSHKQYTQYYESSSKRVQKAGAETAAQFKAKLIWKEMFHLLDVSDENTLNWANNRDELDSLSIE